MNMASGNVERLRYVEEVNAQIQIWYNSVLGRNNYRQHKWSPIGFITAYLYLDTALNSLMHPFAGQNFHLKHGNSHPHTASVVKDCLDNEGNVVFPWSAHFPDLNLFEHMWDSFNVELIHIYTTFITRINSGLNNRCQAVIISCINFVNFLFRNI